MKDPGDLVEDKKPVGYVQIDADGKPRFNTDAPRAGTDARRCYWCQDIAQDTININGVLFPIDVFCREHVIPRILNRLRRNVKG